MATVLPPLASRANARGIPGLSDHAWKLAVLAVFATWILVVGAAHEPWVDEAQAWLLARDNGFYELLAYRVRYEGTPGLWHAILWVAIRAGLPYSQLFLISASQAIAGAAIVLWRAPFPAWMRVAIIFSYFFAYQFAVLARSYSVDLFLVPLLAAWYAARVERPVRYALVLGLIANLNAQGFVAGAALGLELTWALFRARQLHTKSALLAIVLAGGLGLLALFSAWQPADNGYIQGLPYSGQKVSALATSLGAIVGALRHAFVDRPLFLSLQEAQATDRLMGFGITLVALRASIKLIAHASARVAGAAAIGAALLVPIFIYGSPWHSGLIFLFWIFALWICWPLEANKPPREVSIGVSVILGVQIVQTVSSGIWDLRNIYSPASDAAVFVQHYRNTHPDARFAGFGFKTFAMQPYFAANQFANYKGGAPKASWIDWRRGEPWNPKPKAADWQRLLEGRPDLIVASLVGFQGDPREFMRTARRTGYVVTHQFGGEEIWRGADYEDDSLVIFERERIEHSSEI